MIRATTELQIEWVRLNERMHAAGYREFLEEITQRVVEQWDIDPAKDWNPHYQWGIDQMKVHLGDIASAMNANEYEEILAGQAAYEKLK